MKRNGIKPIPSWLLFAIAMYGSVLLIAGMVGWPAAMLLVVVANAVILLLGLVLGLGLAPGVYLGFPGCCPRCMRRGVKRLARSPGFYECVECKARLRATWKGWLDASGPQADRYYRPRSTAGRWTGYVPPRLDKSSLGILLRKKWQRNRSGPIKPVAMAPPATSSDSLHDPWIDG